MPITAVSDGTLNYDWGNFAHSPLSRTILGVLNTLLFSQDPRLIGTLQSVCASTGISPRVCSEPAQAAAVLAKCKFYGVIIDGPDLDVTMQVLSIVRASSSSLNAISIVVSDGSAGELGGTFALRKPVAFELAMRTLRAAKGLMLNEFRRYTRQPVQLSVVITRDSGGELQASCINVSQRGLAVQMASLNLVARGDAVRARLILAGRSTCIETKVEMKGKVAWTDARGRAGIQCAGISPRDRQLLEEWLAPGLPQN